MPHPALDRARPRRVVAAVTAAVLSLAASVAGVATAGAAAGAVPPPVAAAAFDAALCPGTTETPREPAPGTTAVPVDPTTAGPEGFPDLTHVSGPRLDAYNAGQVVPLYNLEGDGDWNGFPPLCSLRYDAQLGGPVTEWMFCTDVYDHTCGEIRPDGGLALYGEELPYPETVPAEDVPLTDTQVDAIARLVQAGYTSSNGSVGRADAGTAERWTLQQMIWCVSNDYECDAVGLDDAAIAELASQTQEEAGWVEVSADAATVTAGSPVRVEVSTNVLGTPIGITTDLADLALCADSPAPATFAGQQLVVDSAAGSPATVALCGVATTPGEATFTAVGITPDDHFQRSDATGLPEGWGACQIYVLWRAFAGQEFGDDAVITVEPAATPEPEESPTTDVPTDETGPTDAPATDAPTTAPAAGTGEGAASDAATDPAQAQGTSGLATTGAGVGTAALVAALLVAAGTAVVLWRRRAA